MGKQKEARTLSEKLSALLGLFLIFLGIIIFPDGKLTVSSIFYFVLVFVYFVIMAELLGIPCPICKKWKAGIEQSRVDLGKDIFQIFYKCKYCSYE